MKKEKEDDVQSEPLVFEKEHRVPKRDERKLVNFELNLDLFKLVENEIKKQGISKRSAIEYGLERFLEDGSPKVYQEYLKRRIARLGLKVKKA